MKKKGEKIAFHHVLRFRCSAQGLPAGARLYTSTPRRRPCILYIDYHS